MIPLSLGRLSDFMYAVSTNDVCPNVPSYRNVTALFQCRCWEVFKWSEAPEMHLDDASDVHRKETSPRSERPDLAESPRFSAPRRDGERWGVGKLQLLHTWRGGFGYHRVVSKH